MRKGVPARRTVRQAEATLDTACLVAYTPAPEFRKQKKTNGSLSGWRTKGLPAKGMNFEHKSYEEPLASHV